MPLRIDEMLVVVSEDNEGEGVCSFYTAAGWMPMVAADQARLDSFREIAKDMARTSGKKIKILKFSRRSLVEEF